MKKIFTTSIFILLLVAFLGCESEQILPEPTITVSYSPMNPKVGDTVTIRVETNGEYVSLFTGDPGHEYEKSRIKAIMENDWESFYDSCYRVPLAPEGLRTTWNTYLKDYQTMDQVYETFEFFGDISNIELGVYEHDFPEALMNTTYPSMNQLKFTVDSRMVPSGFTISPDMFFIGGNANKPGFSIMEMRFVSCDEDRALRKSVTNYTINSYYEFTTEEVASGLVSSFYGRQFSYYAYPTNDPLSARPTEGFHNFSEFFQAFPYLKDYMNNNPEDLMVTDIKMFMNGRVAEGGGNYFYDLDKDGVIEGYAIEIDTLTGFPADSADYSKYIGFQGDVYVSYLEIGSKEYEPWSTGVSMGSIYSMTGIDSTYQYVYADSGVFEITAIATNMGRKKTDQIDYRDSRIYSLDDFDARRSLASASITVTPETE